MMGYIAEYSKPLLEHEHNGNEHHHIAASCKQNGAPEVEEFSSVLDSGSRDGADVRVDILDSGNTEPEIPESGLGLADSDGDAETQSETTSKQECCSRWGFKDMPPLPALSPVDPFLNDSYYFSGLWEWLKLIICAPLLILRVLIFALLLLVGFCCTKLALWGWERNHKPMPLWRREIMWGTRVCARGILFCFGFHWIQRIGKPAPREVAPIVVSNHVSYIDPIFYLYELFPTIVSSSSHNDRLFVGTIIRSMQVILVDRLSPNSRKEAISEIKRRAASNDFPRVLLFPEGTTTNGRALISFKPGAFVPGYPVQPVVVRYPHVHFDSSWGNISLQRLIPRMLLQFHNFMQVQYLPVIFPSSLEKCRPSEYAQRVRAAMARTLNVPETEHTFGDLMLAVKASKLKLSPSISFMLEMGKQLQLTTSDAIHYLEKFATINSSLSGLLTRGEFLKHLGLTDGPVSEQMFALFDRHGHGLISFQEFVAASVCLSRHDEFARLVRSTFQSFDRDNNEVLILDEVETMMRSTFSEATTKRLACLLASEQAVHIEFDDFQRHLSRNPELVFPLALAAEGLDGV